MKRRLWLAARLYPRSWRDRYGDEFEALLDDAAPTWRDAADIVRGALQVHLTTGSSYLKFSAAMAAVGLVLGAAAAFTASKRYISTGVVRVESEPGAEDRFQQAVVEVLSRGSLSEIIQRPSLDLYRKERMRNPMEDIVQKMRNRDLRIRPREDGTVEISFAYPDQAKAEATTRALMNEMAQRVGRNYAGLWRIAWPNDPLPPGQRLVLVSEPHLPDRPAGSTRPWFLAVGTAAGLLAAWLLWRPKRNLKLAGFAVTGAILAIGISFLIRDRYTSSAVLRISPPQAPKRLWPALAPEPPAERFQHLAQIVFERDNLARIADKMQAPVNPDDLRIAPAGADAYVISFTYRDRYKAQLVVRELVTQFAERNIVESRAELTPDAEVQRAIELRAGRMLEVLDPATLPEFPVFPNRLAIGGAGLPAGLLAGVFFLRRRRTVQPA